MNTIGNILLVLYVIGGVPVFIIGAVEGWDDWHQQTWPGGGPFGSALFGGIGYALMWPVLAALLIFAYIASRGDECKTCGNPNQHET